MEVLCAQGGFENQEVEVDLRRGRGERGQGWVVVFGGLRVEMREWVRGRWFDWGRGRAFDELVQCFFGGHLGGD